MRHFLFALLLLLPTVAFATVPGSIQFEGQLLDGKGQSAPDGNYQVAFRLYPLASGGAAFWQEGPLDVTVAGGVFSVQLGAKTPLSGKDLATGQAWLALQVAQDPETSRQPLASVPFALRAQVAEALACSGCVTADMLDTSVLSGYATTASLGNYAAKTDLSGYAPLTSLSAYAEIAALVDYVKSASLAKVAFSGKYSDLVGLPSVSGLPQDGLSTISNGLLTDVFTTTTAHNALGLPIKDCYGLGVSDGALVPDVGLAKEISVTVNVFNSDLTGLTVQLIDPLGQAHTLWDKAAGGTQLTKTWDAQAAGLNSWLGQNPKGTWQLKVIDSLCGPGGSDGQIESWSIATTAMSASQVAATGDLVVANLLGAKGLLNIQGSVTFGGAVSFQGTPIGRVYTASADALADGASLDLVTGGTDTFSAASAWVQNGATWSLIPGDAGPVCSACGDGGEGDFIVSADTTLLGNDHQFSNLTIGAGATLTPRTADPLIIRVNGTVTIDGTLTLDGGSSVSGYYSGGTAGPAGGATGGQGNWSNGDGSFGNGPSGGQPGKGGGTGYNAGNGSGGGHAVAGATSGPAIGGSAFGSAGLASGLEVGSGGGGGGGAGASVTSSSCPNGNAGAGGGGGAGAALIIAQKIVISATGKVSANGGAGSVAKCGYAGNGGGGSGGTIWLRANSVAVDGALSVAGGVLTNTPSGAPGRIRVDGALTGAWTPPLIADLATKGSFFQGSGVGPNPAYTFSQPAPGTVRVTNHSGSPQSLRLVVVR